MNPIKDAITLNQAYVQCLTLDEMYDLSSELEGAIAAKEDEEQEQEQEQEEQANNNNINLFFNQDGMVVGACDDFHLDVFIDRFPHGEYEYSEVTLNDLL